MARQLKRFFVVLFLLGASGALAKPLEIRLSGVDEPLAENVRLFLSLTDYRGREVTTGPAQSDDDDETISEAELRRLHAGATAEITSALKPFGYYRATVEAELVEGDQRWFARYRITRGPPTRLAEVNINVIGDGQQNEALQSAKAAVDLSSGDRLVHSRYEAAKSRLYETAYQAGYVAAQWDQSQVRVHPDKEHADLDLMLNTGDRFYFGEVSFNQDVLNTRLLQRFVQFEPGEPYDTERLLDLQLALDDSNYFKRVEVVPQRQQADADRRIPIRVNTTLDAPRKYTVGVGFGTDTGPRLKVGAELDRLNRAGHRLRADLRLSTIENALAARYEIPIKNVVTDTLAFTASVQEQRIGDADTDQFALGVSRNETWHGFRRRLYLDLRRENFQFTDIGERSTTDLLYPGITLSRQRADDLQYPRRGYSASVDLRGASEGVFSDTSFARIAAEARWVRAIGEKTRVLLRGELGAIETSAFDRLPPSQRFFTGGDRSVRGYGFQDIGARNAMDANIGGKFIVAGSVELDHLFFGDYGAALFIDSGDAFNDSLEMQTAAGLGFRWRSPIGMVRVDVAYPVDDRGNDLRLHISIGPDL